MDEIIKISLMISVKKVNGEDYISLTDMAKSKNERRSKICYSKLDRKQKKYL